MTPVRGLRNLLIRAAFRVLIGPGGGDLLSGYRAFGRHFLGTVAPRAVGFEFEADLASEPVARRLRVVEVPVPYRPRIAGTASKLRAFRDGRRILATIVAQSIRLSPWRPLLLLVLMLAVAALCTWPRFFIEFTPHPNPPPQGGRGPDRSGLSLQRPAKELKLRQFSIPVLQLGQE